MRVLIADDSVTMWRLLRACQQKWHYLEHPGSCYLLMRGNSSEHKSTVSLILAMTSGDGPRELIVDLTIHVYVTQYRLSPL